MTAPNSQLVFDVLADIYGQSVWTSACAKHITEKWDDWNEDAGRDLITHLHLCIWDWFPGGTTADFAAHKIMAALE